MEIGRQKETGGVQEREREAEREAEGESEGAEAVEGGGGSREAEEAGGRQGDPPEERHIWQPVGSKEGGGRRYILLQSTG
jgi:hypothetical protein